MDDVTALGARREEYLAHACRADENPEALWLAKLEMDARLFRNEVGRSHLIIGDITAFVSPVDGKEVSSRSKLREHNLIHGVTNASDYENEWKQKQKHRDELRAGTFTDKSLRQSLEREFERRS